MIVATGGISRQEEFLLILRLYSGRRWRWFLFMTLLRRVVIRRHRPRRHRVMHCVSLIGRSSYPSPTHRGHPPFALTTNVSTTSTKIVIQGGPSYGVIEKREKVTKRSRRVTRWFLFVRKKRLVHAWAHLTRLLKLLRSLDKIVGMSSVTIFLSTFAFFRCQTKQTE